MKNPIKDKKGSHRVNRGGCWNRRAWYTDVMAVGISAPGSEKNTLGFRLVKNVPKEKK